MTTRKQKIFLVIFGLVITLLLLEVSLRLAGLIYKSYRINNEKITTKDERDAVKILCLGDSITFGLGAELGYDYPSQLEKMLNQPQKKYIIYNQGYPGLNSSQILKRLPDNIDKYKPSLIVLLVGSNNRFNLTDSNYYLFADDVYGKFRTFFYRLDGFLMKSRTYKFFKIAFLKFKSAMCQNTTGLVKKEKMKYVNSKNSNVPVQLDADQKRNLELASQYFGQRKFGMAAELLEKVLTQNPANPSVLVLLASSYIELEKYDLALAKLEEAILNNSEDANVHCALGRLYYKQGRNNPLIKERNFELAVKDLEKAVSYAHNLVDRAWAYYYLSEVFFEQGNIDLASKAIKKALEYQPDNEFFRKQLQVVSKNPIETPEEQKIFDKLLYYDLDCIARIAKGRRIKLILLSHPRVANRNEIREQVAIKYKIAFIDITSIFAKLLNKYSYKDLFSDDASHPNANGYRIIAESIYKVINSMKI